MRWPVCAAHHSSGSAFCVGLCLLAVAACAAPLSSKSRRQDAVAYSRDGIAIAYTRQGRGDTALVLVHGWAGNRTYWSAQVEHFARTMTVLALDLAGHGSSGSGRRDRTIRNFANDVAAVVKHAGVKKVYLVGHSLGGPVVVEAAFLVPDQALAVIGVDTFFDFWATSGFAEVLQRLSTDFASGIADFARDAMFTPASDTALVSRIVSDMVSASPDVALPALAELQPWTRTRAAAVLGDLPVPLGVIQASTAGHTGLTAARPAPRALVVDSMPGTGHFLMMERPREFNIKLEGLVQRLRSRPAA